ncbi:MAG: hypothetical protein IIB55_05975, partial [Planctomycetes bacterium]|nr:hypothetical protein [Planctomycetota bacterium]
NLRRGRFKENGYRFLPEADFSIQGCDANKSCESAFRLAKVLSIPLRVTFEWREKEDAAHPGNAGAIEWSPAMAPIDSAVPGSMTWRDATVSAIRQLTAGRVGAVFTLAEFREHELGRIVADTESRGRTPERTLERVCQELRDQGILEFIDNRGTYRLI